MHFSVSNAAVLLLQAASTVSACAHHQLTKRVPVDTLKGPHVRRGDLVSRQTSTRDWDYAGAAEWGAIKPEYDLCSSGTTQSPINILSEWGLSTTNKPTFSNYDTQSVTGSLSNWGFGPSYTLTAGDDITTRPTMQFGNSSVYLLGWHIHLPTEHQLDGVHRPAELHLVHVTADGTPAAVVGIMMDVAADCGAGAAPSSNAFATVPAIPTWNVTTSVSNVALDMSAFLKESGMIENYWTYAGSLTTPPCAEGLRWFVSKDVLSLSQAQMDVLVESSGGFNSARPVQEIRGQRAEFDIAE